MNLKVFSFWLIKEIIEKNIQSLFKVHRFLFVVLLFPFLVGQNRR